MAQSKSKITFLCSDCGNDFPKWHGKCPSCGEWGTVKEFTVSTNGKRSRREPRKTVPLQDVLYGDELERATTGIPEVDRVLGGGILPGSVILLGGNPGIGKSTLALQAVAGLKQNVLYVSAEESEDQIALRARRLAIDSDKLTLTGENCWEGIEEQLSVVKPAYLIIDSIQTIYSDGNDSLPGAVGQIRECGQKILERCKSSKLSAVVIGHVTKDGIIAGPRMLEHMVDTVLYLEGDGRHDYRLLRAVKNRFGSTSEVGVFEMTEKGLVEVANPSELFLAERNADVAGSAVVPSMEGSRPILVEVQALTSNANFGTPQRNVTGFDIRRLAMLLAVLEKRLGFPVSTKDVFVNFVGGLRIDEPAADLAVISAIASSLNDSPLPADTVLVGEVGLGGELRGASHLERRMEEAKQLGFKSIIAPVTSVKKLKGKSKGIKLQGVKSVREAFDLLL
ncbi:MAG TPA: DNA repair protein RadA [Candidatus Marinimicrobia bacterium]|nr:DNA repair protein RadA [Candidatus Neomarinimicrobiota bacterium]HIA86146.1 DNA repair protein RadA [Candidatus Neomarinimicrobiota bacterium]HIB57716.1 DNA repair protein RadA [Candidatus Neomarinimicrobiota bacterium]